jgi:predicted transposase YdaD
MGFLGIGVRFSFFGSTKIFCMQKSIPDQIHTYIYTVYIYMNIIGKKEEGRKEGRKEGRTDGRTEGRKEGRKENHIIIFIRIFT